MDYSLQYQKTRAEYLKKKNQILDKTIHNRKYNKVSKQTDKVPKTSNFICSYPLEDDTGYRKYKDCRKHIHRIATTLKSNQWINISYEPFSLSLFDNSQQYFTYKPIGLYTSKGDWLFHDLGILFREPSYINLIEVDYSLIKIITNKKEALEFTKQYGQQRKGTPYTNIKWNEVAQNYKGFAFIPNIVPHRTRDNIWLLYMNWALSYDVATLIIWDKSVILNHRSLFKISDRVDIDKIYDGDGKELKKLVDNIITSIE
jgi:hypothetical protein